MATVRKLSNGYFGVDDEEGPCCGKSMSLAAAETIRDKVNRGELTMADLRATGEWLRKVQKDLHG